MSFQQLLTFVVAVIVLSAFATAMAIAVMH